MKLLHLAQARLNPRLFTTRFCRELSALGVVTLMENGAQLNDEQRAALIRESDILLTGWGSAPVPAAVAGDHGRLRYICHLTGSLRNILPREIIQAGLPVSNWGDASALPVAEGALALLLASLKQLPEQLATKREGGWLPPHEHWIGSVRNLRLGLYGFGYIGSAFHALCRPLRPRRVAVFDPFATEVPHDIHQVASLEELFAGSDAIAVHAALTNETQRSVTRELLARLPEGGIFINTARGDIVDQDALFSELASGRLRAGLDVLAGDDRLPAGHPATTWPNLILTSHLDHCANWPSDSERLEPWQEVALDNLKRFQRGEPLRFVFTAERLARST